MGMLLYQCHNLFDQWQHDERLFICRIKTGTKKKLVSQNMVPADSIVFFDAMVLLGTPGAKQSQTLLRQVGYKIKENKYRIATNRHDLAAEQIAQAYKLRWNIENLFARWKRHVKVSIRRVLQLRTQIANELRGWPKKSSTYNIERTKFRSGCCKNLTGNY